MDDRRLIGRRNRRLPRSLRSEMTDLRAVLGIAMKTNAASHRRADLGSGDTK